MKILQLIVYLLLAAVTSSSAHAQTQDLRTQSYNELGLTLFY